MSSRAPPAESEPNRAGSLNTEANIPAPDDFYQELIDMHRGLSDEQSALVNAKLILLLANHIGDAGVLREAMAEARLDVEPEVAPKVRTGDAAAGSTDIE